VTSEVVRWGGHNVPVLHPGEISRYSLTEYFSWVAQGGYGLNTVQPVQTTWGKRASEPIANNFQGYVQGMLYADGTVAAVEQTRLDMFSQLPLLFQEMDVETARPGKFYDDPSLDLLRAPWVGGTTSDLMTRELLYADFGGNSYKVI
jgi:hypothetical protein